jgi:hypothetical protein
MLWLEDTFGPGGTWDQVAVAGVPLIAGVAGVGPGKGLPSARLRVSPQIGSSYPPGYPLLRNQIADTLAVEGRAARFWTKSTEFRGNKVFQRNDLIDPSRLDAMVFCLSRIWKNASFGLA